MASKTLVPNEREQNAFLLGNWTVEPELNSLRNGEKEQRVEPKVMKVLLALVANGTHVVSKERLLAEVWPNTFVSDDVLTRCISILRRIMEDDSHAPRLIQTVPRTGYRLLAPIQELPSPAREVSELEASAPWLPTETSPGASAGVDFLWPERGLPQAGEVASGAVPAGPLELPPQALPVPRSGTFETKTLLTALAALLATVMSVLGLWAAFHRHSREKAVPSMAFRTVQFTAYAGEQTQPAFSSDGGRIAYAAVTEDGRSHHIYVKRIGEEIAHELTPGVPDEQFSPAWSPDGRTIAYLSRGSSGLSLDLARLGSNGPSRHVYTPQEPTHWDQGALAWSPDGRTLIFPDHKGSEPHSSIYALDLRSGRARALTAPPAGWEGDLTPAFSPDGTCIAFTRASETSVRYIYNLSLADGTLHALTRERMNIDSLTWAADGRSVLFSSNQGGKYALWSVGLHGEAPQRLPFGTEDAFQPSTGPKPGQLAYTEGSAIWSIVRIRKGSQNATPEPLLTSTQQDSAPSLSPDGRSLSFQSLRSGSQEIWVAPVTTGTLRQLTFAGGPLTGSPAWSRHGDRIAFDSRPDGHSHIFAVQAVGGTAKQLTFGDSNDIVPRWSQDDRFLYFRSNRGGSWQLWKIAAAGGEPQPVSRGDGMEPQESSDGRWLFYTRGEEAGLWRMPAGGGEEMRVLSQPAGGYWGFWQLAGNRIYYLDLAGKEPLIRVATIAPDGSLHAGQIFAALETAPPRYAGLAVADDGESILMTEERAAGRHITLVEPQ